MDYYTILDTAVDLGYELAMCGAETYRVEESITFVLRSYGIESEVFAIPNNLIVSIETPEGKPMTRMRRIGYHGNDLDAVERFSGLSRAICNRKPEPAEAKRWLEFVRQSRMYYSTTVHLFGDFLGALGLSYLFGAGLADSLCAGICGLIVGLVTQFLTKLKANSFFSTIAASFLMALAAYGMGAAGLAPNPDAVIIGALMILVPGLLFTNAMRDIIYGDTNSGVNRIVQVFLIAIALALGTAVAWSCASALWGAPVTVETIDHNLLVECIGSFIGCLGFAILFNIHGFGSILCTLGGVATWIIYSFSLQYTGSEILGYFFGSVFSAVYSEIMARVRKCPTIAYLVVSIFPLIPGAGVYYTMNYAVQNNMDLFASRGMFTAAIAGVMAVGILLVSTSVRMWNTWKFAKKA